jgi:hypothetical protein
LAAGAAAVMVFGLQQGMAIPFAVVVRFGPGGRSRRDCIAPKNVCQQYPCQEMQ